MPTRVVRRWLVPGIAAVLALGACAPGRAPWAEAGSAAAASTSPGAPAPVGAAPTGSSTPPVLPEAPEEERGAEVVDVPPVLAPVPIPGLVSHYESSTAPSDQRGITTVTLAGVDSLGDVLGGMVSAEVGRYAAARRPDGVNVLTIGWGLVQTTGPVLGVQFQSRSYTGPDDGTVTATASVYTDVTAGTTWTSADLVADHTGLAREVSSALDRAELAHVPPDGATVDSDLRFRPDGSVTVVLDRREAGLESLDTVAVNLPADGADAVLSDAGRRVRDAAVTAAPFAGVPPAPGLPPAAPVNTPVEGGIDCTQLACIALTFDDGPGPYTGQLLDELAAAGVHATFFVIGQNAGAMPDLVRRAAAEGHAIGNHTWDHPHLPLLPPEQIADEVDRTTAALAAAGVTTDLVRPPYGETDDTVGEIVGDRGYGQVLWDVDTEDWLNRDVAITTQRALAGARPGAVVLMHDIHPTTVQAVPGIIAALRAEGYTFVTVPQLLGEVEPGAVYGGS